MINGLEDYLRDRRLLTEVPLSCLANTRLGIDLSSYIHYLLRNPRIREPLLSAIGGTPLALISYLEVNLKTFEKDHIKPIFVGNGLPIQRRERPFTRPDDRGRIARDAWELWRQGKTAQSTQAFGECTVTEAHDVILQVLKLFRQRRTESFNAPYRAGAQLVYLERSSKEYVHAIYGSNDLFCYDGIDRIILGIDFVRKTISFASKTVLLADLGLNNDLFLDLALLAGGDYGPAFPPFRDLPLSAIADYVKQARSGMQIVKGYAMHPEVMAVNYADLFIRGQSLFRHALVFAAEEGRVLPLPLALPVPPPAPAITAADIPSNLEDVFSHRLPEEVYHYVCRGLIKGHTLEPLVTGYWIDTQPLCGGDTVDYKRFLKETLTEHPQSPRCIALALLASVLNPYWAKRDTRAIYWFDAQRPTDIPHASPGSASIIERVANWNVEITHIEEELRRQNSSTIDMTLCLGATSAPGLGARTRVPRSDARLLDKKDEIVANTLWRFLEMRAFLTSAHLHTPHGKAMHLALKQARLNDKFQEPLYLALELLKANVLHAGNYGQTSYLGGPRTNNISDEDRSHMLLVMRTLSIVPATFLPVKWAAPISHELLAFNSFLSVLQQSMRILIESTILNLFVRGDARRRREDFTDIALALPFQTCANTAVGVVFKLYCDLVDSFAPNERTPPRETKDQAMEMLQEGFASMRDVKADLQRGFRFWDAVMIAVRSLRSEKALSPELGTQFEKADAWLQSTVR